MREPACRQPGPLDEAILREELLRSLKAGWAGPFSCDPQGLPYPRLLVGSGNPAWDSVERDVCPDCGGGPLAADTACIRCNRWGLDFLV